MIPWGWVVAALLTGVYGGLLMAGMMKQASDADACLGCYWRQVGMATQKPLCDLDEEHNAEAEMVEAPLIVANPKIQGEVRKGWTA